MNNPKVIMGARMLVGLIFVVFGLNGFLQFLPMPQPTPEGGSYLMALMDTGFFFPVLKITEIVAGLMLLSGKFIGLGLVLLAPIVVQIFLYHVFLDMNGLPMAVFLVVALAFLGKGYSHKFKGVLEM